MEVLEKHKAGADHTTRVEMDGLHLRHMRSAICLVQRTRSTDQEAVVMEPFQVRPLTKLDLEQLSCPTMVSVKKIKTFKTVVLQTIIFMPQAWSK